MAIDPATASLALGALGSLFGGKSPGLQRQEAQLAQLNKINALAMELYNNADLQGSDAKAVGLVRNNSVEDALNILGQYDAQAGAGGSPIWKGSTVKDRARSQIAGDAANRANSFEAQLETSRANRQAALLPNPSGTIAGMQGAAAMDQFANQEYAANQNGLFSLASGILPMFNKTSKVGTPPIVAGPLPNLGMDETTLAANGLLDMFRNTNWGGIRF